MKPSHIALLAPFALVLVAGEARATTRYVANAGTDSPICGAQADPCRSIGQAIANSGAGDTIVVGPGTYGDLTGNEDFAGPGEEAGGVSCSGPGIVCVDKILVIESSHGAEATLLQNVFSVEIVASGAVFGTTGKGFTLNRGGVLISAGTSNNTVRGNIMTGSVTLDGTGHTFADNRVGGTDGAGVFVVGLNHSVHHNVVSASPSIGNGGGAGFEVSGAGHSLTSNVALSKAFGVSVGNASNVTIQGNSLLGNSFGLAVNQGVADISITGNNLFANGVADSPSNCGLINYSGTAVDAIGNYWGASSGPGSDPADDVCNDNGSTTQTSPASTLPFAVTTPGTGGGSSNGAPVCTAAQAVPSMLWPANGELVTVWLIGVGDPDSDPVSISVSGVTQDEPTSGLTTGDTGPDATLVGSGVKLRAQRDSGGNGRMYRVQFTASDGNGGSCNGAVTVGVPNSQKPGQPVVDDGQNFDATLP